MTEAHVMREGSERASVDKAGLDPQWLHGQRVTKGQVPPPTVPPPGAPAAVPRSVWLWEAAQLDRGSPEVSNCTGYFEPFIFNVFSPPLVRKRIRVCRRAHPSPYATPHNVALIVEKAGEREREKPWVLLARVELFLGSGCSGQDL